MDYYVVQFFVWVDLHDKISGHGQETNINLL